MMAYPQRSYWPIGDWQEVDAQRIGIDSAHLAEMEVYIAERLPGLHGLLIVRHGYLAFERYYQGFHRGSYHSISSATKSVISILIGVALAQGLLTDLDQPVLDFFPEFAVGEQDSRKYALTLRHLLRMQTGFAREFPPAYWLNPVQCAVERPMIEAPGKQFFYDSQGSDILSGILTRATGKNAAAFANATLFKQLGIWREKEARFTWRNDPDGAHLWHGDALWDEKDGYLWKVDPQENNPGSFGVHFTVREMAKLGYLYLNGGNWEGEQIVPAVYVRDSTRQQNEGGAPVCVPYGYQWWITQHGQDAAFFASGFGSKLIYVIPTLDLVVVTVASTEKARQDPTQERAVRELVPRFLLPAIKNH
jgi:CubicO group peptidase (beta-lactamase class C family)